MEKTCSKCRALLPLDAFSVNKNGKHGRNTFCKSCHKAYASDYHQQNKVHLYEVQKVWKQENADKVRGWSRKKQAERRVTHRGDVNAAIAQRKEHVKRATPSWANAADVRMWYDVASVLSRSGVPFHVDHVIPLRGRTVTGLHCEDNLTVIPAWRNVRKSNSISSINKEISHG